MGRDFDSKFTVIFTAFCSGALFTTSVLWMSDGSYGKAVLDLVIAFVLVSASDHYYKWPS